MPKLSQRGAVHLIILLLLLVGIAGGVYLVNKSGFLTFKPKAANDGTRIEFFGTGVSADKTTTSSQTVNINAYYVAPSPSPTPAPTVTPTLTPSPSLQPSSSPTATITIKSIDPSIVSDWTPTSNIAFTVTGTGFSQYPNVYGSKVLVFTDGSGKTYRVGPNITSDTTISISAGSINSKSLPISGIVKVFFQIEQANSNGTATILVKSNTVNITFPTVAASPSPSPTRVFITSNTYNGNLGGLNGADAKCQQSADAVNLGGGWKAWLSDGTTSAMSRVSHNSASYTLVNASSKVADNWTDLTDGSLSTAITMTENKTGLDLVHGQKLIWSNTKSDGNISSADPRYNCNNWTSNNGSLSGNAGLLGSDSSSWTVGHLNPCSADWHLYCFEQGGSVQGVAYAQNTGTGVSAPSSSVYPDSIKISNTQAGLTQSCPAGVTCTFPYTGNPTAVNNWKLTDGNGQKTVWAQFLVNNQPIGTAVSASISYTIVSSPSTSPSLSPAVFGKALQTGDGTQNKTAWIPGANLNLQTFTLEGWFKAGGTVGPLLVKKNTDTFPPADYGKNYSLDVNNNNLLGYVNTSPSRTVISSNPLSDNKWHHIAFIRKPSSSSSNACIKLYIDGQLSGSQQFGCGLIYGGNGSLYLGFDLDNCAGIYNCSFKSSSGLYIDELRISNVERYAANFTPQKTPFNVDNSTVGLWHFDGDLIDVSGHNAAGQQNGAFIHYVDSDIVSSAPTPQPTVTVPYPLPDAGWNLIGIPISLPPATNYTAANLINDSGCVEVAAWNQANQGWANYGVGSNPPSYLNIQGGKGYFLKCNANGRKAFSLTGIPVNSLPIPQYGWNLVAIPYDNNFAHIVDFVNAFDTGSRSNIKEIDRYDAGGWESYINGLPVNKFPVAKERGYFVKYQIPNNTTAIKALSLPTASSNPAPTASPKAVVSPSPIPATNPVCSADVNWDGVVNGADVSIIIPCYGKKATEKGSNNRVCSYADVNKDGVINGTDISIVVKYWSQKVNRSTCPKND